MCNLASIAVNQFVDVSTRTYDFKRLKEIAKVATKNLNKIIDANFYPVPEARKSNMRHRPIGIGIQGLADAFILMRHAFESEEAMKLNKQIFETIYYGAMEASCELAEKHGTYETYEGSPVSKGVFQYDMWKVTPTALHDWAELKKKVAKHGVRNSLLLAPMPTASTAQILGNNEGIEAYTSNIYSRRVLSGEFQVVNQHLLRDLTEHDLWDDDMKNQLIAHNGSIQNIEAIPDDIKALYKTVWEISQKNILQMAADRGAFIDQSQSLNIHIAEPNYGKLSSMHFYGWKLGLKTGKQIVFNSLNKSNLIPTLIIFVQECTTSGQRPRLPPSSLQSTSQSWRPPTARRTALPQRPTARRRPRTATLTSRRPPRTWRRSCAPSTTRTTASCADRRHDRYGGRSLASHFSTPHYIFIMR